MGRGRQLVRVLAQALLNQDDVVQRRDDGEDKGGAEEFDASDPDPAGRVDFVEKNKKDGADLRERIGFSEDAGTEVAESGDGEQNGAGGEDRDVAAENDNRVFPRNFVKDGEDQENRAQQELVGNGIEVLSKQGLLMQPAGEQPVKTIAEAGDDEHDQGPLVVAIHQVDHDERYEDHAEERELVGGGEDLRKLHARSLAPAS